MNATPGHDVHRPPNTHTLRYAGRTDGAKWPESGAMNRIPRPPTPPAADRRKGERRQRDGDPPGRHERRKGIEPRQPEVSELDLSHSEWAAISDLPPAPPKKK